MVAERRSVSAAAKVLYVTQPALTTRIKNLERELGNRSLRADRRAACGSRQRGAASDLTRSAPCSPWPRAASSCASSARDASAS